MRYPASETAEKHLRILEAASALFRERGFAGVSVGEIMRATGLTHGPFYNHFASKEALMSESLEHASQASLAAIDAAGGSPERLLAHIDNYLCAAHRDAPEQGCLLSSLAIDVSRESSVQAALTRHLSAAIGGLGRAWGRLSKKAARRQAIHTLSSMVGAMVLARAVDDPALSDEILSEVRTALRQSVRATTAP
jgi:TetR/AcrR family transcriptional repressor of nem operon